MQFSTYIVCLLVAVLVLSGCSQIQYVTNVNLVHAPNNWQAQVNEELSGELVYRDSTISFSFHVFTNPSDNDLRYRLISFGPPLIPIIPNLFAILGIGQSNYITLTIDYGFTLDTSAIDLANSHLLLEDGTILYVSQYTKRTTHSFITHDSSRENTIAFLYYDLPNGNIEKFQVVLRANVPNDVSRSLQPLTYRRSSRYRYVPWVLGIN